MSWCWPKDTWALGTRLSAVSKWEACSAGVFFGARDRKARDRKFAAIFAAILTWEKWVGKGSGKMDENTVFFPPLLLPRYFSFQPNSHSLGRIFVSPHASSEFESKMALDWSDALARDLAKIRLHCRLRNGQRSESLLSCVSHVPDKSC